MIRFEMKDMSAAATEAPHRIVPVPAAPAEPDQPPAASVPTATIPLELSSDLPPRKPPKRRPASPKKARGAEPGDQDNAPLVLNLEA